MATREGKRLGEHAACGRRWFPNGQTARQEAAGVICKRATEPMRIRTCAAPGRGALDVTCKAWKNTPRPGK
jgi:hypothetical protein